MDPTSDGGMPADSRYVNPEQIGHGGSGSVMRAWDTQLGRWVAIKRIRPDAEIEAVLQKEAAILASMQHPNIVTIFDVNSDSNGIYVVMELVNGQTLDQIAENAPMDLDSFLEMADQVCRGLSTAHAHGLVHQDLKPANLMIHYHEDQTFTVKILDFGLAKTDGDPMGDDDTPLVGSVHTMAPEQLLRQPVDARTDIYSLGCVFYYALMGHFPYDKGTVQDIVNAHISSRPPPPHLYKPTIPQPLSMLIVKMMSIDPNQRPQNIDEIRRAIQQLAGTARISRVVPSPTVSQGPARAISSAGRASSAKAKRETNKAPIIIAASLILGIAAFAGAYYYLKSKMPATANTTESVAATPAVPVTTWSNKDIGDPTPPGEYSYDASSQQYTVSGGTKTPASPGTDTAQFVYRQVSGDCTITAYITGQQNTAPHAFAGLMIRESLKADAASAWIGIEVNGPCQFFHRAGSGVDRQADSGPRVEAPYWVRLVRQGDNFIASISSDGEQWKVVGGQADIPMSNPVYIGLAVNSGNTQRASRTLFTSVSILSAH